MVRCGSKNTYTKTLGFVFIAMTLGCQMEATEKKDNLTSDGTATPCSAENYTHLIGQDSSALDDLELPNRTRILRPGMAKTMDYIENRLNFDLDGSGKIQRISCG